MIYFYHIQRTGGRSLTRSIFEEFSNPSELWMRCHGATGEGPIIEVAGKKIIPWYMDPISLCSDFFYSWDHFPAHAISLPDHCFTITILRDPVTRFISLYRYLKKFDDLDIPRSPTYFDIHSYLRPTIMDTVAAFPDIHRYQMLYHFSSTLDVDEAVERIREVSYWFRMENYAQGLVDLRGLLGLKLPWIHWVDGNISQGTEETVKAELTPDVLSELTALFRPEYELLEKLELS